MARLHSSFYAKLLVAFALFCAICAGFIVLGKSDTVNVSTQQPPSTFTLSDATYLVSPSPKHKNRLSQGELISVPCTVIRVSNPQITEQDLLAIHKKLSQDDVWIQSFLSSLILISDQPHQAVQLSKAVQQILENWSSQVLLSDSSGLLDLPSGPYYFNNGNLHEVYRLYHDTAEAFISATIQSPHDPYLYTSLNVSVFTEEYPSALTLGVPSRLYFTPTEEKPLAGLRIAIKDTQDVRGVKTTGSSRSYARLYGPREKSATGVQRLLDHGAIVIGKLKSTQFGESEWATSDWVDYHAPWNPRADGYQTPSASSSGSGAAAAAYDWLDLSTGTDCSGSVRAPAAIHGVFGIRPSTGAIDNGGVIPFSKNFDTFGLFTRDIDTLSRASSVLYNQDAEITTCFKKPTRIVYLTEYWPVEDEASSVVFERNIQQLEKTLGTKRTELSLGKLWSETNPVGTNLSIGDFFNNTFVTASSPDQWDMLKNFHAEYHDAFGHAPPLNPQLQWKMEFLPSQTVEMQKQGEKEIEIFRTWFEKHVMLTDQDGCSETILVLPWTQGQPSYRDEYRERPSWIGDGWFFYFISVYAGAPEVIVPIGQTPYESRLTKRQEWLPVAIGLVGARGTDAAFASFVKETMENAELPTTVDAGRNAFSPNTSMGNNAVNVSPERKAAHPELK
ncbi:unnamed protein product [Penicillium salamii]|uniref:Amidase domain-containing protein n=1 Tax=Penicillium salamii TaxID=1612424 RepID=A0A9W4NS11_9EURO|nr:unnamed protein product [Penicillium salamii]CAG8052476.1 unnamed protein product [Penicillium salamii]CAG8105885.1 unnamed protein product [Penicillium salamii]CAG8276514.1 unnamed protein product [Penicillium salamii]CAG8282712.1 unnamed protein product [Penicillium salamii]